MAHREYPIVIEPLSCGDGGGFLATVPDLPGCMSDGRTSEEAAHTIADAISAWIDEAKRLDCRVPDPLAQFRPRC